MGTLLQDLHYSLRQLIKNPGFSFAAILSLALGIGATTAVFSIIYAVLIDPYPYRNSDRIVRMSVEDKGGHDRWMDLNGPQLQKLRQSPVIESLLIMGYNPMSITGGFIPENVDGIELSSNAFRDLGVPPFLGRGILPSDAIDGQDPQPVVVLSYKFWRKHFFGDTSVLGRSVQLNRKSYLIVGVAAPRFTWYSADIYLPLKITQDLNKTFIVDMRLSPGVDPREADVALQPLLDRFAHDRPKQFPESFKVHVERLNDWVVKSIGRTLYLIFAAVSLLLTIGCGNISILLLARGTGRKQELAVRAAVGASRYRILRQLLTEALMLSAAGATLGVLAAFGILKGIGLVLPQYAFAPEVAIHINLPVCFFSVSVAFLTGVLFGLWPALQLSRTELHRTMQSGSVRTTGDVQGRRTHSVLVSGQIALTLLLLTAAGSAMTGFLHLLHVPLGYDPQNVVSIGIPLHENTFTTWAERSAYFEQLLSVTLAIPGVNQAAISSNATPPVNGWNTEIEILGKPAAGQQRSSVNFVSPEYFGALRIPLLQGRSWSQIESHAGRPVAIVNQAFVRRYFLSNDDPVGHFLKFPKMTDRPQSALSAPGFDGSRLEIIGVTANAVDDGLRNPIAPAIYVPYTLSMEQGIQILVRSEIPPATLLRSVQAQIARINPEQQTYGLASTLEQWISDEPEWQQEHLVMWIFAGFALLALALATVGLYSVVSYTVVQRTNEFGIRMALGAQRSDILRSVLVPVLWRVVGGVLGGFVLMIALHTIFDSWSGGHFQESVVLVGATFMLALIAVLASAIPARHASTVEPMEALRRE